MTRKDFQLIADVLQEVEGPICSTETRDQIATAFARALRTTNPQFDRERFLRACGVEGA